MKCTLLVVGLSLLNTIADTKGVLPTGTQVKGVSQCVDNTLHMECPPGNRIHVIQVFYGRSNQGCSYDPKGCVRQDRGFHSCTGQRICDWVVPAQEIPTCGVADYVSVTHRCLPDSEITDICSSPRFTEPSGYLSSPRYPAPLPITQHSCKTSIILAKKEDVIVLYIHDLGDGDCKGRLIITEKARSRPKALKLCSSSIRSRGQRVYISKTHSVEVTYEPLASSSDKGFLVYYQAQAKRIRPTSRETGVVKPTTVNSAPRQSNPPAVNTTDTAPSTPDEVRPIPAPELEQPEQKTDEKSKEVAKATAELSKVLISLLKSKGPSDRSKTTAKATTETITKVTTVPTTKATEKFNTESKKTTILHTTPSSTREIQGVENVAEEEITKVVSSTSTSATTTFTEGFLRGQVVERVTNSPAFRLPPQVKTPVVTTRVTTVPKPTRRTAPPTTPSTMPDTTPKRTTTTKRTIKTLTSETTKSEKNKKRKGGTTPKFFLQKEETERESEEIPLKTAQASISETTSVLPVTVHPVLNGSTTPVPFGSIFGREKPRDSGPWAAIVGGVIASIAGILLLVIIGIMIWEKRKKKCARTRMYDDVIIASANARSQQELAQRDQTQGNRLPIPRNRVYENVQINGGFIPDEVHLKRSGTTATANKDNAMNEARSSDPIPGFGQVYQNTEMSCDDTDTEKCSYDEVSMDQIRITTPRPVPAKRQSLTLQRSTLDTSEDVYCEIGDNGDSASKPQPPARTASRRDPPDHKPPKPPIKPKPKVGSLKRWLDKASWRQHKEPEVSPDSLIDVQMVENEVYESEEICKP